MGYYQHTHPHQFNDNSNIEEKQIAQVINTLDHFEPKIFIVNDDSIISAKAIAFYSNINAEDSKKIALTEKHGLFLVKKWELEAFKAISDQNITLLASIDNYFIVRK